MTSQKSGWSADIGLWVAFAALGLLYAFDIALIAGGGHLDKAATTGTIGWTAILFAYAWRKMGRSGWSGFFIGLALSIVAIPALIFLVHFYRSVM